MATRPNSIPLRDANFKTRLIRPFSPFSLTELPLNADELAMESAVQHERGPRKPKIRPLDPFGIPIGSSSTSSAIAAATTTTTITARISQTRLYGGGATAASARNPRQHSLGSRRMPVSRVSALRGSRAGRTHHLASSSLDRHFAQPPYSSTPTAANANQQHQSLAAIHSRQQLFHQSNIGFSTNTTTRNAATSGDACYPLTPNVGGGSTSDRPLVRPGFEQVGNSIGGPKKHSSSSSGSLSSMLSSKSPQEKLNQEQDPVRRPIIYSSPLVVDDSDESANGDNVIIDVEALGESSDFTEHTTALPSFMGSPVAKHSSGAGSFINQGRLNNLILSQSQNFLASFAAAAANIPQNFTSSQPTNDTHRTTTTVVDGVDSQAYRDQLLQNPLLASYISHISRSPIGSHALMSMFLNTTNNNNNNVSRNDVPSCQPTSMARSDQPTRELNQTTTSPLSIQQQRLRSSADGSTISLAPLSSAQSENIKSSARLISTASESTLPMTNLWNNLSFVSSAREKSENYLLSPPSIIPTDCPTMQSRSIRSATLPSLYNDGQSIVDQHSHSQLPYWHLLSSYQTSNIGSMPAASISSDLIKQTEDRIR